MSHLGKVKIQTAKSREFNLEKCEFQVKLPLMTNDTQLLLEEKKRISKFETAAFFKRGISGISVH